MYTTSISLLERLKTQHASQDWERFVQLYTPLIYHWARRKGLPVEDSSDLVQDVFSVLLHEIPSFRYDRSGSFSRWLRTITVNKCRDYYRRQAHRPQAMGEFPEPTSEDNVSEFSEQEYQQSLARRALEVMQNEFEPNTWKACWDHVVSGHRAADIAEELGMTVNAVYVAKSRVLRRLREELGGLWD